MMNRFNIIYDHNTKEILDFIVEHNSLIFYTMMGSTWLKTKGYDPANTSFYSYVYQ